MLGARGVAIGIEHIPELTEAAIRNIRKENSDLLDSGRLKLVGKGLGKTLKDFNE